MDTIERLAAIEDIKQLKARYFRTLDAHDWPAYVAVFTEDAGMDLTEEMKIHSGEAVDAGTSPVSTGRDEIAAFISSALDRGRSVHEGHMPIIEITGEDTAEGSWSLHDWIQFDDGTMFHGYGFYRERYRKVGGQWLISYMTIERIRVDWGSAA